MKTSRWGRFRVVSAVLSLVLILAACGDGGNGAQPDDDASPTSPAGTSQETEGEAATGEPINIGWLTDASSVTRGTYFPEYEGANLYFQTLNENGGVNGRPVELLVEDINIDQELAVTLSTKLAENQDVIMLAGGTIEGRQPAIYEVARENDIVFMSGHSARPDMFPPDPDPLLFTAGNVFEAMSDARVQVWPQMFSEQFPDGGTVACYIHEAPASAAVCDRWFEFLEQETDWEGVAHINAPLQTQDFSQQAQQLIQAEPDTFFDISIAAHAVGMAVAARNAGYQGPIAFSMTATPETDIQQVVDQVGGENLWAISNITSIDETDVEEIQRILDAAEKFGTEIPPNSATVNGWLMGMIIHDALERCGADCDRSGLRDALENTNIDTKGLTGGPFAFTPSDHVGPRYWTGYRWNPDEGQLERVMDDWVEFNPDDLFVPLGGE